VPVSDFPRVFDSRMKLAKKICLDLHEDKIICLFSAIHMHHRIIWTYPV